MLVCGLPIESATETFDCASVAPPRTLNILHSFRAFSNEACRLWVLGGSRFSASPFA